jgi:hypothetical protein
MPNTNAGPLRLKILYEYVKRKFPIFQDRCRLAIKQSKSTLLRGLLLKFTLPKNGVSHLN